MEKETIKETKEDFYKFGMMMVNDSQLLYDNDRLHNSVYFAVFALEAYLKIMLIKHKKPHIGHITKSYIKSAISMLSLTPEVFKKDCFSNMIRGYNINDRYKIEKWTNPDICKNIQVELKTVKSLLIDLDRNVDLQ